MSERPGQSDDASANLHKWLRPSGGSSGRSSQVSALDARVQGWQGAGARVRVRCAGSERESGGGGVGGHVLG